MFSRNLSFTFSVHFPRWSGLTWHTLSLGSCHLVCNSVFTPLSTLIPLSLFVYSEHLYHVAEIWRVNCSVITVLLLICSFHSAATNLLGCLLELRLYWIWLMCPSNALRAALMCCQPFHMHFLCRDALACLDNCCICSTQTSWSDLMSRTLKVLTVTDCVFFNIRAKHIPFKSTDSQNFLT